MKNKNGTQIDKLNDVMKKIVILILVANLFACTKEEVTKIVTPDNPATAQGATEQQPSGTVNGGGGKGVMCSKNGIKTVETLDLYEARILYGLEINQTLNNQEEAVNMLASLTARHFWNPGTISMVDSTAMIKENIRKIILNKIRFITTGKKLKLTNDSFEPLVEKDCEMVQLAHFYDESSLLIDKSLWEQMNWTNRIALVAHELFYYMHRQRGATNSVMSRKIVGMMLSTAGLRPMWDGMPDDKKKIVGCNMQDANKRYSGYFYAFETKGKAGYDDREQDGVEFVFTQLPAQAILFRTSLFMGNIKLNDVLNGLNGSEQRKLETPIALDTYEDMWKLSAEIIFNQNKNFALSLIDQTTGNITGNYIVNCNLLENQAPDITPKPK